MPFQNEGSARVLVEGMYKGFFLHMADKKYSHLWTIDPEKSLLPIPSNFEGRFFPMQLHEMIDKWAPMNMHLYEDDISWKVKANGKT